MKLYFNPSVRQDKIPEIQNKVLDSLKDVTNKGKEKLEKRDIPNTELDKDLREINERLYDSDLKIYKYEKKLNNIKTKIHNLSLSIGEDLELNDEKYLTNIKELMEILEEYETILENRINTFEEYQLKLEKKI